MSSDNIHNIIEENQKIIEEITEKKGESEMKQIELNEINEMDLLFEIENRKKILDEINYELKEYQKKFSDNAYKQNKIKKEIVEYNTKLITEIKYNYDNYNNFDKTLINKQDFNLIILNIIKYSDLINCSLINLENKIKKLKYLLDTSIQYLTKIYKNYPNFKLENFNFTYKNLNKNYYKFDFITPENLIFTTILEL